MIPQLMALPCCTYLTYGDGDSDEIEYASREVKQKSCLSAVANVIISLVSRLSMFLEIWPITYHAEAEAEAPKSNDLPQTRCSLAKRRRQSECKFMPLPTHVVEWTNQKVLRENVG